LKLINNIFSNIREIKGFTKEEIIEVKKTFEKFNSQNLDKSEIDNYLKERFPFQIIEDYSKYIEELIIFSQNYLLKSDSAFKDERNYYELKAGILNETTLMANNLITLKLNAQNTKRFLKNNSSLEDAVLKIQNLLDNYNNLISQLGVPQKVIKGSYDNIAYIWTEVNKIKNSFLKVIDFPNILKVWEEIKELETSIGDFNNQTSKRKKLKKTRGFSTTLFNDLYQIFDKKQDGKTEFYSDLIFLLFQNHFIENFVGDVDDYDDFVNVIDRKDIDKKLKDLMHPIVRSLMESKFKPILEEIEELDNKFNIIEAKKKISAKSLLDQKVSEYVPKIAEFYLNGLEKKYQSSLSELKEYDEFKNIKKDYSEKVDNFYSLFENINANISKFNIVIHPYEVIINSYEKIVENVLVEITRRREEYLQYLKTIKKERLQDHVRNFIYEKINEVNNLMSKYQDETALIVREEFPQLKQVREIVNTYKRDIQKVKDSVYNKLNEYKEKNVEIYQIIKQWEDNFAFKKQQLSFLLSTMLSKLFKLFKDVIKEEDGLFESLAEISEQKQDEPNLPLNFALSSYLMDKLTERELNERISEIKLKVENLSGVINLYQTELTNLENKLRDKVQIREGITSDKIKCGVCHKNFNFAKDQIIKCPFCEAVYHYLCVAFWLTKYNSCPSCQNSFVDPNAGLYSSEGDRDEEQ